MHTDTGCCLRIGARPLRIGTRGSFPSPREANMPIVVVFWKNSFGNNIGGI